jgi:hypothetical protein
LVLVLVPIEQLRDLVREVAHATFPTLTTFNERHVRVDVCPASTTTSDHGIVHDGDFGLTKIGERTRSESAGGDVEERAK